MSTSLKLQPQFTYPCNPKSKNKIEKVKKWTMLSDLTFLAIIQRLMVKVIKAIDAIYYFSQNKDMKACLP